MDKLYDIEDIEYANMWQKAYGVSDDELRYLSYHQARLGRFDEMPTFENVDQNLLAQVHDLKSYAQENGELDFLSGPVFDKVSSDFVHTTAAYEGNTLSAEEVSLVLQEDIVIPGHPLSEHIEVVDIKNGFLEAVRMAKESERLTVDGILKLHKLAAAHLPECDPPGEFRWDMRWVTGSPALPPPPKRVESLISQAVEWYNEAPSLQRAAGFHLWFEDVHPFPDGNGRVGRIVANFMIMKEGLPPIAFKDTPEAKEEYYSTIREFVSSECPRDASRMANMMLSCAKDSLMLAAGRAENRSKLRSKTHGQSTRPAPRPNKAPSAKTPEEERARIKASPSKQAPTATRKGKTI